MKQSRLTNRAIELYRQLLELCNEPGATDQWEEDGGKRRQYLDTQHELHALLGRRPWETCISHTIGCDAPPGWMVRQQENLLPDWWSAHEIRVALDHMIDRI